MNSTRYCIPIILGVFLTGCPDVRFLYPLYTEQDLARDADISGEWVAPDNDVWRFVRQQDGSYTLTVANSKESIEVEAHLARLSNHLFLDVTGSNETVAGISGHLFLKVTLDGDLLEIADLKNSWLVERITKDRALAFERPFAGKKKDPPVIVTASTADLQNFLLRHASSSEPFGTPDRLRRR